MHPYFYIFGYKVATYTIFTFLALFVVFIGGYLFSIHKGFSKKEAFWMMFCMSVSAFLGGRLFNLLVNYSYYKNDIGKLFEISTVGFSLYGGILGAVIAGFVVARVRKINLMKFADTIIPFVFLGISTMRIGCLLNGCCYGVETDSVLGIKYPPFSQPHIHQIGDDMFGVGDVHKVHPTQVYEMIFSLFCFGLAMYLLRKSKLKDGSIAMILLGLFSGFRWFNMGFRELSYSDFVINILYPVFYFSLILISIFFVLRINFFIKRKERRQFHWRRSTHS